jgi:hypothetical protein
VPRRKAGYSLAEGKKKKMNDTEYKARICDGCYKNFLDYPDRESVLTDHEALEMAQAGTVFESWTCAYCADN